MCVACTRCQGLLQKARNGERNGEQETLEEAGHAVRIVWRSERAAEKAAVADGGGEGEDAQRCEGQGEVARARAS